MPVSSLLFLPATHIHTYLPTYDTYLCTPYGGTTLLQLSPFSAGRIPKNNQAATQQRPTIQLQPPTQFDFSSLFTRSCTYICTDMYPTIHQCQIQYIPIFSRSLKTRDPVPCPKTPVFNGPNPSLSPHSFFYIWCDFPTSPPHCTPAMPSRANFPERKKERKKFSFLCSFFSLSYH